MELSRGARRSGVRFVDSFRSGSQPVEPPSSVRGSTLFSNNRFMRTLILKTALAAEHGNFLLCPYSKLFPPKYSNRKFQTLGPIAGRIKSNFKKFFSWNLNNLTCVICGGQEWHTVFDLKWKAVPSRSAKLPTAGGPTFLSDVFVTIADKNVRAPSERGGRIDDQKLSRFAISNAGHLRPESFDL